MSIYGIGVDLCSVSRIEKSLTSHGDLFADKILHPNERSQFQQLKFKARFLAKRFAAKEAFAKAMGTGIADGVAFLNIEVYNLDSGKPEFRFHGQTLAALEKIGDTKVHLSITDEREMAMAQVIIELK